MGRVDVYWRDVLPPGIFGAKKLETVFVGESVGATLASVWAHHIVWAQTGPMRKRQPEKFFCTVLLKVFFSFNFYVLNCFPYNTENKI